ncbi:hypothetical protein TRAPUB_9543 [Trametes pubescens]|uniref:Uncharacterized protein n=1 Tax=Trametes pubescens TaxID=154538 RepID=A0A1M2W1Z6_TRAPU|nr:hypothetical protein TRAPUB_9543 [Trametes pubescens]
MEPAPSDSNTATATSWIERDHLAKLQITLTLDDTPLSSVILMKTSTNTWDKLMSRYEGKGKQMIVTLIGEEKSWKEQAGTQSTFLAWTTHTKGLLKLMKAKSTLKPGKKLKCAHCHKTWVERAMTGKSN